MSNASRAGLSVVGEPQRRRMRQARWLVLGVLLPVHLLLTAWLACRYSPTSDEVAHLAAGLLIWKEGRFDLYPVNPPLVKLVATAPLLYDSPQLDWGRLTDNPEDRREWEIGQDLFRANPGRIRWDFVLARWACLPFTALGLWTCWLWGSSLWGPQGGVLAAWLWTFSPNILGNAALITPDVAAAALGLASCYAFRQWLNKPTPGRALQAGMALGAVWLTKFTWLFLAGLWPALWLTNELLRRPSPPAQECRGRAGQMALLLSVAGYVLHAGYAFDRPLPRWDSLHFVSRAFGGETRASESGGVESHPVDPATAKGEDKQPVRLRPWWMIGRAPAPAAVVQGLDLQRRDFEGGWRPLPSYLWGEQRQGGWWYYYCVALWLKSPPASWALAVLAGVSGWRAWRRTPRSALRESTLLLAPALLLFVLVSSQTGFTRSLRYVLPSLPFFFVALGGAVAGAGRSGRLIAWALAGVFAIDSLSVYPHSLGYFHPLVGGPRQGHWSLLDSNLDWGQDLYALQDWRQGMDAGETLYVAYAGVAEPQLVGLDCRPLPPDQSGQPPPLAPGWCAISVNLLHGYDLPTPVYASWLNRTPDDWAGVSIALFRVRGVDDAANKASSQPDAQAAARADAD